MLTLGSTDQSIPIDSKFSWENYKKMLETKDENLQKQHAKDFAQDIANHIEEVSGYVDCIGLCFNAIYIDDFGWDTDTFCDDGSFGIVLTCEEWGCDACACMYGENPPECVEMCGFNANNDNEDNELVAKGKLSEILQLLINLGYRIEENEDA